jgi:hypothetical protein
VGPRGSLDAVDKKKSFTAENTNKFKGILMVVYCTQNYRVSGLCQLSHVIREHSSSGEIVGRYLLGCVGSSCADGQSITNHDTQWDANNKDKFLTL